MFAICRCGHHAIIDWISDMHSGEVFFRNCPRANVLPPNSCSFRRPTDSPNREAYIFNLEDRFPEVAVKMIKDNKFQIYAGPSDKVYNIIVMRDPYNLYASRKFHVELGPRMKRKKPKTDFMELWIVYAEEVLRTTQHIDNPVFISFNEWFSDRKYRDNIAQSFGLKNNESIQHVAHSGGGSTFDKKEYEGEAQKMKVLERYKTVLDDPYFKDMINNERVKELSLKLFPSITKSILMRL